MNPPNTCVVKKCCLVCRDEDIGSEDITCAIDGYCVEYTHVCDNFVLDKFLKGD